MMDFQSVLEILTTAFLALLSYGLYVLRTGTEAAVKTTAEETAKATIQQLQRPAKLAQELQIIPTSALEAQRDAATDPLQFSFAAMMYNMATGIHVDGSMAQEAFPDIKLKSGTEFASQAVGVALPRQPDLA